MDYTHCYQWKHTPDPQTLQACMEAMVPVINDQHAILAGPNGFSEPEIDGVIAFNGKALSAEDLGDSHGRFNFPGNLPGHILDGGHGRTYDPNGFNFCTTARKPYDGAVVACLLIARDFFPKEILELCSHGDWRHEWRQGAMNWRGGVGPKNTSTPSGTAIYQRVTGTKAKCPWRR